MKHPPYMVGQGTFLPVGDAFDLARRSFPGLQQVGVAWNPAESNSAAFTAKAREACARLGLTLLEANVDNSSAVVEAINSLVSRGAQALWVGGDNTMLSALATVIATAHAARIPVFTITPGAPDRGTLFDMGLDFHALGRIHGLLASDVLSGVDPGDDSRSATCRTKCRDGSSSTRASSRTFATRGAFRRRARVGQCRRGRQRHSREAGADAAATGTARQEPGESI